MIHNVRKIISKLFKFGRLKIKIDKSWGLPFYLISIISLLIVKFFPRYKKETLSTSLMQTGYGYKGQIIMVQTTFFDLLPYIITISSIIILISFILNSNVKRIQYGY
jgi:hypothetical protein